MPNWFHVAKGIYNIPESWIGLDYARLFLKPAEANGTLAHEVTHNILSTQTDFGLATRTIIQALNNFTHLSEIEKVNIGRLMMNSQLEVQEGLATYMQIAHLERYIGKKQALAWADNNFPKEYLEMFDKFRFAIELSVRYRDFLTAKVSTLAMNTNIRKVASGIKLFDSPKILEKYLLGQDNNPNGRLEKILDTIRLQSWMVTKPIQEIASSCGITYYDPETKEDVADFLNYLSSKTKHPKIFTVKDVGDSPKGIDAYTKALENMVVGNLNLNFAQTSEVLFNFRDFLFYAPKIEVVFLTPYQADEHYSTYKSTMGEEPEIIIGGITNTGEKYITVNSRNKIRDLLKKELKEATIVVKAGGYDPNTSYISFFENITPTIVIYNTTESLMNELQKIINAKPNDGLFYLHAGATKDHPLQTLYFKLEKELPWHVVNTFGNKGISTVIKDIKKRATNMPKSELRNHKNHLNNLLSFWMGLPREVDWIESMLTEELHLRQ